MNLVQQMKSAGDDFEFYPTTPEILAVVKSDIDSLFNKDITLLDCGAGDGQALTALARSGRRYAIEKSTTALKNLPLDVIIVGTDFHQQTLLDKHVDVVFCNPPYSEFSHWMVKIINETTADTLYFVVPNRWQHNPLIKEAITRSEFQVTDLGDYDFLSAQRPARASVNVIRLRRQKSDKDFAFHNWFRDHFNIGQDSSDEATLHTTSGLASKESAERAEKLHAMIPSNGLIESLVTLYDQEMSHLISNYRKLSELDADLLAALSIDTHTAAMSLKSKIEGLKNAYWKELFSNLDKLTDRLTTSSRGEMLRTIMEYTTVDFTYDNAHAIILWAIRNTNSYLDKQLLSVIDYLLRSCCIKAYKSNKKLFVHDNFRYRDAFSASHYMLETRCIISTYRRNGLISSFSKDIDYSVRESLNDLLVIASQLGFDTYKVNCINTLQWAYGNTTVFHYIHNGKCKILMEVKPFKNGNLHIKFSQKFMLKLNIEMGRLKGWIHSKEDCAREFDVPVEDIEPLFNRYHIKSKHIPFLITANAH